MVWDSATHAGRVAADRVRTELMIAFALPWAQPKLLGSLGSLKKGMSLRTIHRQKPSSQLIFLKQRQTFVPNSRRYK